MPACEGIDTARGRLFRSPLDFDVGGTPEACHQISQGARFLRTPRRPLPINARLRRVLKKSLPREPIALAVYRNDVLGVFGVVFDLLPKPGNVHVHGSRERNGFIAPNLLEQFIP